MYKCVFKCVVRYSFKSYDRVLEAIGFGMHEGLQRGTPLLQSQRGLHLWCPAILASPPDPASPGETIEYAKKKAVTEAYKNAFQSMAIILLRTGKVALHFLGIVPLTDFVCRVSCRVVSCGNVVCTRPLRLLPRS